MNVPVFKPIPSMQKFTTNVFIVDSGIRIHGNDSTHPEPQPIDQNPDPSYLIEYITLFPEECKKDDYTICIGGHWEVWVSSTLPIFDYKLWRPKKVEWKFTDKMRFHFAMRRWRKAIKKPVIKSNQEAHRNWS